MTTNPYVVSGEAHESESEEEIDSSTASKEVLHPCKGKIVFGEAPESDEENYVNTGSYESISSAISALSIPIEKRKSSRRHQSILIKKLYQRNASLQKNITEYIQQIAVNADTELNNTNKRLLKCQMQLQEGVDYLKILNSNLLSLDSSLQILLSAPYLPFIKIDNNTEIS